jgi:hypothetical protein
MISDEDLDANLRLTAEQRLLWLSEMLRFTWAATRGRVYSWEDLFGPASGQSAGGASQVRDQPAKD